MRTITLLLLLCLMTTPAYAEKFIYRFETIDTYGIMQDIDLLDRKRAEMVERFSKEGEIVEIIENPHVTGGSTVLFVYTVKIRVE